MEKNIAGRQGEIDETYRRAVLIVSAQIGVVVALAAASFFISPGAFGPAEAVDPTALMVLIIFIAAASFVIRRLLNRWDRFRDAMLLGGTSGLLSTLRNNALIVAAFGTLMGLIGFAAFIISGDPWDAMRAAAAAIIVIAINFPRKSIWKRVVGNLDES